MAIDLTKPVFILAADQAGGRLAILGGSNDFEEARLAAALVPSVTLMVAVPISGGPNQAAGLAALIREADQLAAELDE